MILNCLKARLLNVEVVQNEKTSIWLAVLGVLRDNLLADKTRYLIQIIARHRWMEGLDTVLRSVKSNVSAEAQDLLEDWTSVGGADQSDDFNRLRAIFMKD